MDSTGLSAERLREVVHYDSETGVFTRLKSRRSDRVGERLGYNDGVGYLAGTIDNKKFRLHRLAWLYVYGEWPGNHLDHINGVRSDNRICNLRNVTQVENQQNRWRPNKNNDVGVLGVHLTATGKYRARFCLHGVERYIGTYLSKEEASLAVISAKRKLQPYSELSKV